MNSLDAEPLFSGLGSGGGSRFLGQSSLMGEYMKGGADPLLSQDPHSVKYNSLIDNEASNDFSEEKLMPSSSLYSLYLLQPNSDNKASSPKPRLENSHSTGNNDDEHKNSNGRASDSEEHIDVLTLDHCSNHSQTAPSTNGLDHDALFEGMPFYELKDREVGPCAYCNMWRSIRFLSYCGSYPFCSVSCTKKFAVYKREKGELLEKTSGDLNTSQTKIKVPTLFEHDKPQPLFPPRRDLLTRKHSKSTSSVHSIPNGQMTNGHSEAFEWSTYLQEHDTEAAPVKCFCHTPLSQEWKNNQTGAMIEVHNRDPGESPNSFWVARVIQMAGYIARLRFEGYGMDSSHDFSLHLLMAECYPVNGAVKMGHVMKPPKGVLARLGNNWQEHLARVAHSGSPTIVLPKNKDYLECKFKTGMMLEAVYKQQISHTIPASVVKTVANRVHVQYENCKDPSRDFWFHESSPWIHPVGWSQRVGHPVIATAAYKCEALDKGRNKKTGPQDAPWDIFNMPSSPDESQFRKGMKLEVVDPLRLGTICVATVMEVLREGYLKIGVDGCLEDPSSWFCCPYTSPSLLPVGFCEYHKIDLQPPRGYDHFDWVDYLRITESVSAPIEIFHQKKVDRGFKVGHKLEAVDLIESSYICVATVTKVAGPLLRIHFDGWDRSYDQWMDCDSPDIYPVGWCEMVSYPLQPPRIHESQDYISITPVCKPASRRKHYPPGEKRRLSLTPALERMGKEVGEDKMRMLPSVYSFSDEENSQDGAPLPPPPKKQLVKKPQNRSNLKLKMPRPMVKHNGKGRPKEAASHHNYALPSSREGTPGLSASHESQEHVVASSSTHSVNSGSNFSGMDLVNGLVKRETTERGEFIVEVEKGIVNCHQSRPDTSLSSLDSPPLSADSSSGSAHQQGGSESRNSDDNPRKFTMKNWSNVENKESATKMLSSRPFKNFGKREDGNEFGIETYDFADATCAPSVTIPSVSKQEKKKKKKKKKNKKKKDKEKDKDKEKGKDKEKDRDKEKEKHKKDGSKKKKSKSDKERKKERRKERAKAKAKASQLQTLLNLPADLPIVMQTDQTRGEENVLNHILNDQHISHGALNFDRTSKVKFSLTPGSSANTRTDPIKKDQPVVAEKLSTLDKLLAKPANEDISVSAVSTAGNSPTAVSDVTVLASVSGNRTIPLLEQKSFSSPSVIVSANSSINSKDFGKPIMQRNILCSDKPKPKTLLVRDQQKKTEASNNSKIEDPSDDPYDFDAEMGDSLPSKPAKEKSIKNVPSVKKDTTGQVFSVKRASLSQDSSGQVFNVKGSQISQDSEASASQTQVQKIIQSVNSSLASQQHIKTSLASRDPGDPKKKAKAGKATTASAAKSLGRTQEELRQLRTLFMQEKLGSILAKQQQSKAKKKAASVDDKSPVGIVQQNLPSSQVGFRSPMATPAIATQPMATPSMATPPMSSLPSPQQGIMGTMNTSEALVQSLMQRANATQPPSRQPPPPPPLPPSNLPIRPEQLPSSSPLSPSHPVFPGFRAPIRDACNMVALSRPPKEFCMPGNVRSPSPTAMVAGLTQPPQMSPTSLPVSSPTGLSPTVSRPPPTYGAHLSQAMRGIPRSPVEPRSDFLPFPAQHRQPVDQGFPMPHPRVSAPQRLPPLQSLLVHQRYPPPPHPKRAAAALGSPQMANPPSHILPPPPLPPPSVPPPPYTLHQAMTAQHQPMTAQHQPMTAQQQAMTAQQHQQQQQSPIPSPLGRQATTSSCTNSPQTSPATSSEPSPVSASEQQSTAALQSSAAEKVNPWTWGIAEVVQFLVETGEGSCADCFYRQNIDGKKLMSLSREQLVKLTGMKVAPSLKIYDQIVKLKSRFPTAPPGLALQIDSVAV